MNWSKSKSGRGRGTSFKGALDYVLHDKKARTDERVGEVLFLNLANDNRETVWREMSITAAAANELKKRAGIGPAGQINERPVYAFTLSWHPKDRPTGTEMMAFAQEAMHALGLQDHQAVIAEHTDRAHKHLHVIVNLVHPVTGRTADLRNDERKLDKLCHAYELKQQVIRSKKRALRMETRRGFNNQVRSGKAEQIKQSFQQEGAKIEERHKEAARTRRSERRGLWDAYRQARQQIYDAYQKATDDFWQRKPRDREFNLRPPPTPRRGLSDYGRDTIIPLRPTLTGRFKQALFRIRPDNDKTLKPSFQDAKEQRHPRVPIGMARHAPDGTRRFQTEELRRYRMGDLANLAADYAIQQRAMAERHETEIAGERQEWQGFGEQRTQAWAEFNGSQDQSSTAEQQPLTPEEARAVELVQQWVNANQSQSQDIGPTLSRSLSRGE